jgi:hypothetical protein
MGGDTSQKLTPSRVEASVAMVIQSSQKKSEGRMSDDKVQYYQPKIIQNQVTLIKENEFIEPLS